MSPEEEDFLGRMALQGQINDLEHSLCLALALLFDKHPDQLDQLEDLVIKISPPSDGDGTRKRMQRVAKSVGGYVRTIREMRAEGG
ncbi:MAG: hypothetical protein EOP20_00665 [Hyphomicrobiales bacterium]|nr:MAG: hypothetical protein EOP20_00665 [Hyphomicrobiales bacterium]